LSYGDVSERYKLPTMIPGDVLISTEEARKSAILDNSLYAAIMMHSGGKGVIQEGNYSATFASGDSTVYLSEAKPVPTIEALIDQVYVYATSQLSWSGLENNEKYYLYITLIETASPEYSESSRQRKNVRTFKNTTGGDITGAILVATATVTESTITLDTNPTGKKYLKKLDEHIADNLDPHGTTLHQTLLDIESGIDIGSDAFLNSFGTARFANTYMQSGLDVTGDVLFRDDVTIQKDLTVRKDVSVEGNLAATEILARSGIDVYGNSVFRGSVDFQESLTLSGLSLLGRGKVVLGANEKFIVEEAGTGKKLLYITTIPSQNIFSGTSIYGGSGGGGGGSGYVAGDNPSFSGLSIFGDLHVTGSYPGGNAGGGITDAEARSGITAGIVDHTQKYGHLTPTDKTDLTDGLDTTLHKHSGLDLASPPPYSFDSDTVDGLHADEIGGNGYVAGDNPSFSGLSIFGDLHITGSYPGSGGAGITDAEARSGITAGIVDHTQKYGHLTPTDKTDLTDGLATTLHKHSGLDLASPPLYSFDSDTIDGLHSNELPGSNIIILPYVLIKGGYSGNIEFELEGAENAGFTVGSVLLDTGTSKTDWIMFNGASWESVPSVGFPTVYELAAYVGTLLDRKRYKRWRAYYITGGSRVYGDWVGGLDNLAVGLNRTSKPDASFDFPAGSWDYPYSNPAPLDTDSGINFGGSIKRHLFDDTAEEFVVNQIKLPADMDPKGIAYFEAYGYPVTAAASGISLKFYHSAVGDKENWDNGYMSLTRNFTCNGIGQDFLDHFTWSTEVSGLGWGSDDQVRIKLSRDAGNTLDTLIGDWGLTHFRLKVSRV